MSSTAIDHPATSPTEHGILARRVLLHSLLLGVLANALLRDPPWGVGLTVWMMVFAGTVVALTWHRDPTLKPEQALWLMFAAFFATAYAWRDAGDLQAYDFVAMLGSLTFLVTTISSASPVPNVLGSRIRDLFYAALLAAGNVAGGVLPLALRDAELGAGASVRGRKPRAMLRAAVITLPLLVLFGALLAEADPVFGSIFALPKVDLGTVMSHIVITGVFTWIVGGWMRSAFVDEKARAAAPDGFPVALGQIEITTVLGALTVLFALFVGVQVTWLFGGEALVRSTTGLGYAQYARRGFFELVWVSLLVLPVVIGTRAAIPPEETAVIRRHRRLTLPLLLLLGAMMLSALGRMRLYVQYYGLTTDRLFASVFMLWLALVFVWFAMTVLRGRARLFAGGMTISGFATLAALNVVNPDAIVARANLGRTYISSDSARVVDLAYLASRSGDAIPIIVRALVAPPTSIVGSVARVEEVKARCDATRSVLMNWGSYAGSRSAVRARDWRSWNYGAWRAGNAVRSDEQALRNVTCWDNGVETRFGLRDLRTPRRGEQWFAVPAPAAAVSGSSSRDMVGDSVGTRTVIIPVPPLPASKQPH